jgi:hypothetical protein
MIACSNGKQDIPSEYTDMAAMAWRTVKESGTVISSGKFDSGIENSFHASPFPLSKLPPPWYWHPKARTV